MKDYKFKKLPKHIGFIVDGNGRWAKKRGMPRSFGHKVGLETLKQNIFSSFKLGIQVVSIFGFSTENWNRPQEELDGLFELFTNFLKSGGFDFDTMGIRLNVMGDYTKFPKNLADEIERTLERTKHYTNFVLNLGINYGGQDELVRAVNKLIKQGKTAVTKQDIEDNLYTAGLPKPDLVIRTSGEYRISNFMLWQMAYSELYFTKTYWPDFKFKGLIKALKNYQKRNRRFGAIKEGKNEKKINN